MIRDLHSYPSYKPSGVEWLGDVPEHWEVRRLLTVAEMRVSNVDKHTKEDELPVRLCNYVDVYKNDRITQGMAFMNATASREEVERFRLQRDDVLITKDSESWDDIGVPALVTEPADDLLSGYHLALLRPLRQVLGAYLARTLQSRGVAYQFHVEAKGVTRYGLTHAGIQSVHIPLPPLPEQATIVRYLDHTDERIRRYIRAKQKLIKCLEETKQAVIHRAVTRGLDPDVPLKPSGVEWLGDVPEHWEVARLKGYVANIVDQASERGADEIYIALEHVESWTGRFREAGQDVGFDGNVKRFRAGDVLFGKLRPYLAKATRPDRKGVCVGEFLVLRPRDGDLMSNYLKYLLRSKPIVDAISASTFGAKMPRADWQFVGGMKQSLPPLPEQTVIVRYLDKATADIDTAVDRARRQIELLREYRTRLIGDVVSGRLDVRDVEIPGSGEEPAFDGTNDLEEGTEPDEAEVMEEACCDD